MEKKNCSIKIKEKEEAMQIILVIKADSVQYPMCFPRETGKGEERSELVKEDVGCWWQLHLATEPLSSSFCS